MKLRKAGLAKVAIISFWLVMMGWLVRYEAYPEFFTNTLEGYRDVLSEGQLFVDSWMKITFKGSPIGISHTAMEVADDDPLAHYKLSNRTLLNINVMGEPQQISAVSGGSLDALYHLQEFDFSLTSRRYSMRIEGKRRDGDNFIIHVKSDLGTHVSQIEIPDDVILYSPLMEISMSELEPGEHLRLKTLDPASLTISDVFVKALRHEEIIVDGVTQVALLLSVEYQGVELLTWIDSAGKVLRQDTPLGWTMESCTADEAMSLRFDIGHTEDMLRAAAVPCAGNIDQPEKLTELRLRLSGAPLDNLSLASSRQEVLSATGSVAELKLRPASWPTALTTLTNVEDYLAPSVFVQSDHPDVLKQARRLVGRLTNDVEKARAIFDWVYRNVKKEPTASLPSTLDVLHHMEGDCNEHTYLFVGLARAAGLPAMIRVGIIYKDGVFYYHAWPAVFVGAWVEMDPTVGQELADASHVGLLEGEMANQIKLLTVFGRLKAEVIQQLY